MPAVSRVISSSGVLPTRSSTLFARATGTISLNGATRSLVPSRAKVSASAGNRGND